MKRIRRKNYAAWTDRWNMPIDYDLHPGALLAKYMQWSKPTDGFANMKGPEPDTINVGVLAPYMITLGLEHEYYYRVKEGPLWVSFGWSPNPQATISNITKPIVGKWFTNTYKNPREIRYDTIPDNILAKNFPKEHRWQYNDIGNY